MTFRIEACLVIELIRGFDDSAGAEPIVQPKGVPLFIETSGRMGLVQHVITENGFEVFYERVLDSRRAIGQLDVPAVAVVFIGEWTTNRAVGIVSEFIHVRP